MALKVKKRISELKLQDPVATKQVAQVVEAVHALQDTITEYAIVSVTFLAPDTDIEVTHGLGRAPLGYYPIRKSAACDVYDGTAPANRSNTRTVVLRGTNAAQVLLRFF